MWLKLFYDVAGDQVQHQTSIASVLSLFGYIDNIFALGLTVLLKAFGIWDEFLSLEGCSGELGRTFGFYQGAPEANLPLCVLTVSRCAQERIPCSVQLSRINLHRRAITYHNILSS